MELITALAVAAISGLSFIAYRHPEAYSRMFASLIYSLTILMGGWCVWCVAVSVTYSHMLPFVGEIQKASDAIEVLQPSVVVVLPTFIAAFAYLCFLRFLPNLINSKTPADA